MPVGRDGGGGVWSIVFFFLGRAVPVDGIWFATGRGEAVGGGGLAARCIGTIDGTAAAISLSAGGVGMGGAGGAGALPDGSEEALE
jgi:hypothetical protein